jgi:hypothetical protein
MSERNCQRRDKKEAVSGVLSVAAYALDDLKEEG